MTTLQDDWLQSDWLQDNQLQEAWSQDDDLKDARPQGKRLKRFLTITIHSGLSPVRPRF
jgi:hypothetical protein